MKSVKVQISRKSLMKLSLLFLVISLIVFVVFHVIFIKAEPNVGIIVYDPVVKGGFWSKKVLIFHNGSDHLYNISVSTNIPENLKDVELYRYLTQQMMIKVSDDPVYDFKMLDTDDNGKSDTATWTIPELSEVSFSVEGILKLGEETVETTKTQSLAQTVQETITFDRGLDCPRCGKHKAPPLTNVNMTISATVFNPVENANLIDYYPNDWIITDANNGIVSVHNSSYNKIEWFVEDVQLEITRWYIVKSPERTIPPTKYYFQSELASQKSDWWMVIVADPTDITMDTYVTNTGDTGSSITVDITTAQSNEIIIAAVHVYGPNFPDVSGCKLNGTSMTLIQKRAFNIIASAQIETGTYWSLASSLGTYTVNCTISGTPSGQVLGAIAWQGVYISDPIDVSGSQTGLGTTPNVSITTTKSNDVVIGAVSGHKKLSITPGTGYTEIYDVQGGSGTPSNWVTGSTENKTQSTSGTVNVNFTLSASQEWVIIGFALQLDTTAPQYIVDAGDNATTIYEGDSVLMYSRWTEDVELDKYVFSWNGSSGTCGTWSNDTAQSFQTGNWTNTTKQIPLSCEGETIAYKFYANNTIEMESVTSTGTFTVSTVTRWLEVNWTEGSEINSTTCTENSPCNISQYSTFTSNATVTCRTSPSGYSCGSISAGIRYNDTTTWDLVNTTTGAEPFYTSDSNPQLLGTLNDSNSSQVNFTVNATESGTGNFFNISINFTSSYSGVTENKTNDAFVCIGGSCVSAEFVEITLSQALIEGIMFDTVTANTIGNPARNNSHPETRYNVTVGSGSTQNLDFYVKLNETFETGIYVNESSSTSSALSGFTTNTTVDASWSILGNTTSNCTNIAIGNSCWMRLYFDVGNVPSGYKQRDYTICGVINGSNPSICG